jgi:hypothetical protein
MRRAAAFFATPALDAFHGLDRCLDQGWKSLLKIALGLALGWWTYVPLHELLHAAACLIVGGSVSRLEIDGMYGGALLAKVFPFVVSGSSYAGRLAGFDTHGSDGIYLATDLGPFLLTLFPGVWWLRRAARRGLPVLFGASLPFALAPFLSLTGDAYEIGSLLTTQLPPWGREPLRGLLRGDDLLLRIEALRAAPSPPWGGLALAATIGLAWAFLTYALAACLARRAGEGPVAPR